MEASLVQTPKLTFALDSVRYQREASQKTYGEFLQPFSKAWDIPEDRPVVGLFGLTNPLEETVVQMGVIYLDTQCQARLEVERGESEGEAGEREIKIAEPEESPLMTYIVIAAISAVILIVLFVAICLFCKAAKKTAEDEKKEEQ